MRSELDELIRCFRSAQDAGVDYLTRVLNLPRPQSNREWPFICHSNGLYDVPALNGIKIEAHGYGIRLGLRHVTIDFDWGENGEPDGFDVWRLYVFSLDNGVNVQLSYEEIADWVDQAYDAGELQKIGTLYFDPNRRATPTD